MAIFSRIEKNRYVDSLETLFMMGVLNDCSEIEIGFVGMATASFKESLKESGMLTEEIGNLRESDFVIVARCSGKEAFDDAVAEIEKQLPSGAQGGKKTYHTSRDAFADNPGCNLCSIAVPGEYALSEVMKALDMGMHCVVFSNNVPLADERKMKEKAREKGLLCMGPDCGVANINGSALVLASINNRGPFGICGASGTGIQHVAAILHECGSGVSQTIGTGGNDLKQEVGGIMMLMGLDALDRDPETEYIILISRKPAPSVLDPLFSRIEKCTKPVVVFFMGCERETVERHGGIWAGNLDDCAEKALSLIGKEYRLRSPEEIHEIALEAVRGMSPGQKYVRGMYTGGTYLDEAMRTMEKVIGPIHSNAPLRPELKLAVSTESVENTAVDYGEEEFTQGRPHPAIDPGIRKPYILREAADSAVAVIILDFILTPPGHMDPVGYVIDDVKKAMADALDGGRKLAFVATVLGTDADFQNKKEQEKKLLDAGVIVAKTNNEASLIAAEIIRILKERA